MSSLSVNAKVYFFELIKGLLDKEPAIRISLIIIKRNNQIIIKIVEF